MRTQAILCAAALAAGAVSSMADSANVYSLNVVGYYNVVLKGGGLTLTANQLDVVSGGVTNNSLNNVLPSLPFGSEVLKFVNNDYNVDIFDGTQWLDNNSGNASTTTVSPGEGFFILNGDTPTVTNTFVGQVQQGALVVTLPPGLSLISTVTPQVLDLSSNSFPAEFGEEYLIFDNSLNDYVVSIWDGTEWLDNNSGNLVTVAPAVGQGYFILNADPTNYVWTRNFSVQ